MSVELAWRRRRRERREAVTAARRHDQLLAATVAAGAFASTRAAALEGRYVETIEDVADYVATVVAELKR